MSNAPGVVEEQAIQLSQARLACSGDDALRAAIEASRQSFQTEDTEVYVNGDGDGNGDEDEMPEMEMVTAWCFCRYLNVLSKLHCASKSVVSRRSLYENTPRTSLSNLQLPSL